jgi:nucleoprotein TPR
VAHYQKLESQAEERFKVRSETMKNKLNAKLKEERERHEAAISEMKAAQAAGTAGSNMAAAQSNQEESSEPTAVIKPDQPPAKPVASMTDDELKHFISSNPVVLDIIKRNIQTKLKTAQEGIQSEAEQKVRSVEAEFEKKREEAAKAALTAQESAVNLEGKKYLVKISMAEKKTAGALAKLGIVEQAATTTPQRPVGEVWAIAKDFRVGATFVTPATDQSAKAPQPAAGVGAPGGPSSMPAQNPFASSTSAAARNSKTTLAQPIPSLPQKPVAPMGQANSGQTGIPRPGDRRASGIGGPGGQGGRGGGSSIPRGGQRGGGNRGGQRGGHNQRGGLNPGANQFAPASGIPPAGPGNKRPHDGSAGQEGNAEKRSRT